MDNNSLKNDNSYIKEKQRLRALIKPRKIYYVKNGEESGKQAFVSHYSSLLI